MKDYSSRKHKGAAYRTPSRWLAGQPEISKRNPDNKTRAHGARRGKNPRGF